MTPHLRDHFLLDPDVIFLNHGSFGSTPRPVFDAYQAWQRGLEWQPVQFLASDIPGYLADARAALGRYVNAPPDDLVFVPNTTFGVNVAARSLPLGPGDEVLMPDHEYGACERAWQFMSRERGFQIVRQPVALPLTTAAAIVEQIWAGVTARTKIIYLSHITSPTAVRFPVEAICARARDAGILTVVDGAHAPGQISLDLAAVDADFYTGNAHKWLCAPKGSAFLYVRHDHQRLIEPLVVGWGWEADPGFSFGSRLLDYTQWLGTNDLSAYLAVPSAIDFQAAHNWPAVRACCHALAAEAIARIDALTGRPSISPPGDDSFFGQMAAAELPPIADLPAFKKHLYDEFRVEIPCIQWGSRQLIRISVQGYNTAADVDALIAALGRLLPGGEAV